MHVVQMKELPSCMVGFVFLPASECNTVKLIEKKRNGFDSSYFEGVWLSWQNVPN